MSVPKFIRSNGQHLSWNRMLLDKIFWGFHREKFVCPVLIHLPQELWYATGFYDSAKMKLVNNYIKRDSNEKQEWMNLYVWTPNSADELREIICIHERPGDQYFLLNLNSTEKFISNFSLCEHSEDKSKVLIYLMDRYCNY